MKYTVRLFFLVCLLGGLCTACGGASSTNTSSPPVSLKVFAASSLTESFHAMAQEYQKTHPAVTITFNFAGSQVLEQQLANGAPADIFASADLANMQKVQQSGLVDSSQIFAKNKLVVIIPANNPAGITSLQDLAKHGVKIDLEAATVPAGKYTLQVLDKMTHVSTYGSSYKRAVLANVVSQEDNVKAVVQKVQLGEVDAGFVYLTDITAPLAGKVGSIEIPDAINVIAQYPIAVMKHAISASEAQLFLQYVLSSAGQAILDRYHFLGVSS